MTQAGEGDRSMLQRVLDALCELRSPFALYESDIHRRVEKRLEEAGLAYAHEARIGQGCRIDYLIGGIGVEIKKGRPDISSLKKQLLRYAACEKVEALVVVTQRAVSLPDTAMGKPVRVIALNQLWGVALK